MTLTRRALFGLGRDFLKAWGYSKLLNLVMPQPSLSQLLPSEKKQKPVKQEEEFTILEKDDDAGSLEECLLKGQNTIPFKSDLPENPPFIAREPLMIYILDADTTRIGESCKNEYSSISAGMGILLNNKGFVLTPHHVVEKAMRDKDKIALAYYPPTYLIRRLKILAYSDKDRFDIALGKVELTDYYKKLPPMSITRGNIAEGSMVYGFMPENKSFYSFDFVRSIFNSVDIDAPDCSLGDSIVKQTNVPLELDLKWKTFLTEAKPSQELDRNHFFDVPVQLEDGYSGLPLQSALSNDLVGLLSQNGHIYTGPKSIRSLIANFIYESTGKHIQLEPEAGGGLK